MLTGQPVRVTHAMTSQQLHQPLRHLFGLRSVLVLPLLHRDSAIGAISLADTRKERNWTDSEVEKATVIARQLAVALANARLFVDLRQSYDDLARTQAELVKRERLAALGELAAVVAHEVRNPLGVIFNSISSLRRQGLPGADSEMLLGIVGEEADRLNRIVGDLLDFSRPHEPELRLVPLPPLLTGVRDALQTQSGASVTIAVEVQEGLPHLRVDGRMLRQALLNLMLNGIQAMPKGGALTVQAARAEHGGRPGVGIEIRDTGPGIAAGIVQRIFEPFYTTKATGTGLGLAVVKRIVDGHRGEISVRSHPGQGTIFTVWLPETAAPS
jgi:signal transduction histidine kinase